MRADRELDVIFQDILSGLSAAGIQRTAMSVGTTWKLTHSASQQEHHVAHLCSKS